MRYCSTLLLLLLLLTFTSNSMAGRLVALEKWDIQYPDDSILNKITDIDERLRIFTEKDTLGGYSAPIKVDMSSYINLSPRRNDVPRDKNGLIIVPFNYEPFQSYTTFRDTIIMDPVMLPVVFDGKILPPSLDFWKEKKISAESPERTLIDRDSIIGPDLYTYKKDQKQKYRLIDIDETQAPKLRKLDQIKEVRKNYYVNYPEQIKSNALAFEGKSPIASPQVESKSPFKELITAGDAIEISTPEIETFKIKQVFWKTAGENSLSLAQKAYSQSWEGRPNDFFSILSYQKFSAQYKKNKITFDHLLEWRLNIQRVSLSSEEKENNPDYNDFLINDDYIRTYNTLGLQSFLKNWSYTVSLEIKTPLLYKRTQANKKIKTQGPFSPLDMNFGIAGIKYTLDKEFPKVRGRKLNMNINVAPLSVSLRHVGSNQVYETEKYGVVYDAGDPKAGERRYTKTTFGSLIDANITFHMNSYSSIYSRMQYNTSYESVKFENETTINFRLNRYFSTKFYVYMKYDDTKTRDVKWKYFSINEELGFGLSYTWN